jgi:MFS family permease
MEKVLACEAASGLVRRIVAATLAGGAVVLYIPLQHPRAKTARSQGVTMSAYDDSAPASAGGLKFKLSVMMFLQFFIWGAWFPMVFDYVPSLGFAGWQKDAILNAFFVSALIGVFFSNQFADRNFAAQRFLAFSHLIAGAAILGLGFFQKPVPFWPFFALMALHTLLYVPTISITNSIAFANMPNSHDFGIVRLWGTIGWIAAAWPFVFILVDWSKVPSMSDVGVVGWLKEALGNSQADTAATRYTFVAAGIASLLLAAFSLVLPHTPPKKTGETLAWLEASKSLFRHPFILVLFIVTFLDAAIHQFYFYWTATFLKTGVHLPANWIMPVMSIGQIAEIVTMAFLGLVLKRLGWRATMVIGILGHAGRFAVFAFAQQLPEGLQQPAAIGVNILHGICYAFFFATVYIFIDVYFPKDARTSAQGLFNMLILGLGPIASNFVSGRLGEQFTPGEIPANFRVVFMVPMGTALVAALLLLLFFHPPKQAAPPPDVEAA